MAQQRQLWLINSLGYAGLIPFAATAAASFFDVTVFAVSAAGWFARYSAVILVFLSGSLWGRVLQNGDSPLILFVLAFSNAIALLGWVALGLSQDYYPIGLALLTIGYAAVLGVEFRHKDTLFGVPAHNYLMMRLSLTVIVLAVHAVMLIAAFS